MEVGAKQGHEFSLNFLNQGKIRQLFSSFSSPSLISPEEAESRISCTAAAGESLFRIDQQV